MYTDADLYAATKRLLVTYQDQGIVIKALSGDTIARIDNPYAMGPRWSPDGVKFAYFGNGRLYIHQGIEAKPLRVVEMPGYDAGFCEWSPRGERLIFSAYAFANSMQPPNIYKYDLEHNSIVQITNSTDVDRFPKWNHSGSHIAFQRTYRDRAENHTGIVIVDLGKSREHALPKPQGFSQRISRNCWSADDQHLIVTEYGENHTRLVIYQIASGVVVWSIEAENIVGGCFEPHTGRVVCVTNNALTLYEFPSRTPSTQLRLADTATVRATLSGPVVIFAPMEQTIYFLGVDSRFYRWHIHDKCEAMLEPETAKQQAAHQRKDYTFRASDGYEIPVQRYLPPQPNSRAVVFIEGGPGEALDPDDAIVARLLTAGYEVIRPAYRGCGGYGDDHRKANQGRCGEIDVRDVVECGIDWRQRFEKPQAPLAVSGYSYGGYLTFLAMTHQDAPWTCGITFWGATMIPPLVQTTGLPVDPDARRKALEERSPVKQAHRIRFPLLILHGERDTTALTEEVETIRDRVRASNIPCQLVVFENESHALTGCRPQMYVHTLTFLEENMG